MPDDTGKLKRLGEEIAGALGDGPSESRLAAQKRDLVSVFNTEANPRRFKYVVPAFAAAAAVALVLFGLIAFQGNDAKVRFWVGDRLAEGNEGTWITSPVDQKLPVRFEGGSRVELHNNTKARVAVSSEDNIKVELKGGEILAQVAGNGRTKWTVNAGPYQVTVMGTIFAVSWDDEDSLLDVRVQRGAVNVIGTGLSNEGVSLAAGDHLEVNDGIVLATLETGSDAEIENADSPMPEEGEPTNEEILVDPNQLDLGTEDETGKEQNSPQVRPANGSPKEPKELTWKDFYREKDFSRSVEAAEKEGIDDLASSLSQEDLWQLATAARYANRGGASTRVLMAFRERFSGTRKAEAATFLLGRVALELKGDPSEASKWFETYLKESPSGSLAEEALGRFVDACEKAGRHELAKKKAMSYLSRYPNGPFAELAQSVLRK